MSLTFDPLESLLAAIVCLLLGAAVNRKVGFLNRYNIPDPVTGGLLFAVFVSIAVEWGGAQISLNATMKPVLLLMFFAGVGLSADLRLLKVGGKALILEFSEVRQAWLKPLYDFHSFQVLPRLGRLFAGDADSYQYLAESIRKHPNQATLKAMMEEAGLAQVQVRNLSAGIVAIHRGYRV